MVESFDNLHTNLPTLLHTMRSIGLEQIGAGVDGGSDDVRRSVGKKSKDEQCIEFVEKSGTIYGIRPQPLMVNGHELDTAESMKRANDFLRWASSEYGAIPRPHCSKMIPGNLEWSKVLRKKNPLIPFLHDHSEYCQAFDFCAPPSSLTHPDPVRREMIELFFREACAIDGGITEIVEALDPECTAEENERRKEKNLKHYDV
jgi:hypothetical protein